MTRSVAAASTRTTALVYVGLGLGSRAISFVLIPFLTVALTPAQYGQIAALTSLSAFLSILIGLGLETAVFRRSALDPTRPGATPEAHAIERYLRVVVPVGMTILAAAGWLADVRIAGAPAWALAAAVFSAGLSTPIYLHTLPELRGREAVRPFAFVSVTSLVAQVGFTVALVIVARLGLEGWAISSAISSVIGFLATVVVMPLRRRRGVRLRDLAAPLRFTLPLLPHQVLSWMTAFVDRLIMIALIGASLAGVYSLSYQASMVLGMMFMELNRAFMPRYTQLGHPAPIDALGRIARTHLAIMVGTTMIAVAAIPVISPILFRGGFGDAQLYLGPLLVAQLVYGFYFVPTNLITLARGRSTRIWLASGAGAASNVLLNFALLPYIGVWGAVLATIAAYAAMAAIAYVLEARSGGELGRVLTPGTLLGGGVCLVVLSAAALAPLAESGAVTAAAYAVCVVVALAGPGRYLWTEHRGGRTPDVAESTWPSSQPASDEAVG